MAAGTGGEGGSICIGHGFRLLSLEAGTIRATGAKCLTGSAITLGRSGLSESPRAARARKPTPSGLNVKETDRTKRFAKMEAGVVRI